MTVSASVPKPVTLPKTWDEEADVVVVGYGFAGSAAAIAAHDAGAKVLLFREGAGAVQRREQPG